MKVTCLLLVPFFFLGCVSFKTILPDEPEEMVDYFAICKKLNKDSNFETEVASENIEKTEQIIYALIKVNNISKPLSLQWKWYNSKQELIKTSKILEVNKSEKYLEFFVAWDTLTNEYFKEQPGRWTVVVLSQNQFVYKKEFEIR